jgi:hypothetical protein
VIRCCLKWHQLEAIDVQLTGAFRDFQRAEGAAILNLGPVAMGAELSAKQLGIGILDRGRVALALKASANA